MLDRYITVMRLAELGSIGLLGLCLAIGCATGSAETTEEDDNGGTGDDGGTAGNTGTAGEGQGANATGGDGGNTLTCDNGCDDGVACTDDECVMGACVNTPVDASCDDSIACTADSCDATLDCVNAPNDSMCAGLDAIDCTNEVCDATLGCTSTPDDALCDDSVACTTNTCDTTLGCQYAPDDSLCDDSIACTADVCDALLDCQNDANVLVFNGSNSFSTVPEDAVTGLGMSPSIVSTTGDFNTSYDAGGFAAIVIDVPSGIPYSTVPTDMHTRLSGWITGGDRLVYAHWNLDADSTMQATLGVTVTSSYNTPMPIHPDPAAAVNLFTVLETFPAPITYVDYWADNGDQLALSGLGFIAGRFNNASTGGGAILVTHSNRVITNGFMISEIEQDGVDNDTDGIDDGEELLRNEIHYLCSQP